jgi:ABC-type glycerol-3-phosphate transport system permease component
LVLPLRRPEEPAMDLMWCDFVESGLVPAEQVTLITHAEAFGPFLRSIYLGGRIISLNDEWHTSFDVFADVPLPLSLSDISLFQFDNPRLLRQKYTYSAWFAAVESLRYPAGIVKRTAVMVATLTLASLLLSVVLGYVLACVPMKSSLRLSICCLIAALVPVSSYLAGYDISVTGAMGPGRWVVTALFGVNILTVVVLRNWFLRVIKRFREDARLDGVGELGFLIRFVTKHSWPVVLYAAVIQFLCVYSAVDWQVLTMGGLWDWTIGVWAVDQGGAAPELMAAVAVLGMIPVFILVAICYPLLSRYSLVPVLREPKR